MLDMIAKFPYKVRCTRFLGIIIEEVDSEIVKTTIMELASKIKIINISSVCSLLLLMG